VAIMGSSRIARVEAAVLAVGFVDAGEEGERADLWNGRLL
jgi:hypothetical protein